MILVFLGFHNVYGPPCDLNPNTSQVIPALCRKILESKNGNLEVWGTGIQRRTFVYVDDAIDAIMLGLKNGFNKGVIQIGSHKSESIKDIAKTLVKISNKNIKIIFDKTKPNGDMDRVPNLTKSRNILKWKQKTNLKVGLEKTYNWVQNYLKDK